MRGYWTSPSATPEEILHDPFYGVRTFIVPPGIVPVQRTSPIPVRKRTPWHPRPDADLIDRTGGRDWLGAHLTLETQRQHRPATYGMAGLAHIVAVLGVVAVVFREAPTSVPGISQPFMVPVLLSLPTASKLFPPQQAQAPSPPAATLELPPPPPLADYVSDQKEEPVAAAPTESPDGVKPESEVRPGGSPDGVEGGRPGGVSGGVPGGQLDGMPRASKVAPGPLRLGPGIEPPRKIKDVKAVYPQGALTKQLRGTVVIEATVGIDGKVHEARVLRSVAGLDQAALDAVLQWEYEPARLNGAPVAVIMTVSVSFAVL